MAEFINFFKSGQVGNTNLTDIFTKQLPDSFQKINFLHLPPPKPLPPLPPPPTIKVDAGVKQFFTTGTTDALDKSNQAIKEAFTKPIDPNVKEFFEKDVKNFITKDVKGVALSMGQNFENILKMPKLMTDLMTNVLGGLNSPVLVPVLIVVGAVVVVQVLKTKSGK
jgi:hypothetical protein